MKNNETPKFLKDDTFIYFAAIVAMIAAMLFYRLYTAAIASGAALMLISAAGYGRYLRRQRDLRKYMIEYTNNLENLSVNSFFGFPLPVSVIDGTGKLIWFNSKFRDIVGEERKEIENISEYHAGFPIKTIEENSSGVINNLEVTETGKTYNVLYDAVEEGRFGPQLSYLLYWIDNTVFTNLKNKYNDERPIALIIQIDNYDEISEKMEKGTKASMTAEVEKILNKYATDMNGFVIKYDTFRFFMMIENKYLDALESKKFSLLEEVKEIKGSSEAYFTLSIGVGAYAKNLEQLLEYAKGALDVALGRGGDQAVVKRINSVKFYGGKSKAVEKRTKVKARIISFALRQMIDQSSNVIIMGHRIGDMDSLGSSIGVYSMVKSRGKKAYIVLNSINHALKNMYERMEKESPEYVEALVNTDTALGLIDQNTLCVVLDHHRASISEAPEILKNVEKIVLIDHHRRAEEFIENSLLDYIEPYASSTSEMVSEMIQYMEDHIKLTKFEADALLAGIIVDTNSFIFKTGVRTFEAASFLRRNGADTVDVKELFSESLESMKKKTEIIDKAVIVYDDIAVSYIDEAEEDSNVIAAQSADELLTIKNVKASFVLVRNPDYINISGRSMGQISVQLIMEYLGGGGHLTMAGAQVRTADIEEARKKLYEAIENYKKESEKI